ncbi:MAG TPA: hypothetical protein VNH11_19165 [Pirellulales bacterium]|nr:hypothetical protein [Pirellulales bacterium]
MRVVRADFRFPGLRPGSRRVVPKIELGPFAALATGKERLGDPLGARVVPLAN